MFHYFLQFIQLAADTPDASKDSGPIIPNEVLWLFIILAAAFFMLCVTRRRVVRRQEKYQTPFKERLSQKQKTTDTMDQMNELMASLADLSRQINGQIDTRLTRLEVLLHQADQAIEKLSQLTGKPTPPASHLDRDPFENSGSAIKDISQKFNTTADPSPVDPGSAAGHPTAEDLPAVAPAPEMTPQTRQVIDLLDQGCSPLEIAQQLQRPLGEIELIISLTRKNKP